MANILYLTIISFFTLFHPLHVSVTEIEHDAEAKRLEIISRIFIDDLELAIKNQIGKAHLDLTEPGEGFSTDDLLKNYIKNKFIVTVNGKEHLVEYVGYEVELPVVYLYAQVSNIRKVKDIAVSNTLIMETYDDQTNLVHVKANGKLKSLKLTENRQEDKLTF